MLWDSDVYIATLGLEESPVGWPKSCFIFDWPSQPADHLTLKSWIKEEMRKGRKEERRKGKEERRKDIKKTEGNKDRLRVDIECGPACLLFLLFWSKYFAFLS